MNALNELGMALDNDSALRIFAAVDHANSQSLITLNL